MKVVNVQATFPSLKGGNACQQGRGEGCNVTSATRAALADMFKHIKVRKTFTEFTAKFQVRDMAEEVPCGTPGVPDTSKGENQ